MPNPRGLGLPNEQSYDTTTIPGVVIDRVTGVFWQRDLDASAGRSWPDADQSCRDLILAGHDDWRLPTRLELVSLVDFAAFDPAVDQMAFPGTPSSGFWSGSLHIDQPETAWLVYSKEGYTSFNQFAYLSQARCVRTDVAPSNGSSGHLFPSTDGTVKDSDTGLTWKQSSEPDRYTFDAAHAQCEGLSYAGHDDWRVPSMTELQTLVDEAVAPADNGDAATTTGRVDLAAFPDTTGEPYWTSSAYAGDASLAWFVDFRPGYTFGYDRTTPYRLRCVR